MALRFGDDVNWIAARHSSSPVCTPTAIDIIAISVAVNTAVLWAPRSWVTPMNPSEPGTNSQKPGSIVPDGARATNLASGKDWS